jgi:ferredoxin
VSIEIHALAVPPSVSGSRLAGRSLGQTKACTLGAPSKAKHAMEERTSERTHHEQHRALTIRGKSFCNSACVFCVEKFTTHHPVAPKSDETRQLILQGRGKYNMLFFMNGEPSLHPKLFEYVELAKANGYRYFGMSSHFRAFADPYFARRILAAGFEFFDISLHAADAASQEEVNPIGDEGRSLHEALHGLRNLYEIARRDRRRVAVTHKIVISRLNYRDLLPIFAATYRFGVRNFILQPVKASGLDPEITAHLSINEDEFMPLVNELLRRTEGSGAEIKLYGMSQLGVYQSGDLVQETNLIKHVVSKRNPRPSLDLRNGDCLIPETMAPSTGPSHRVTVQLPTMAESATFDCREDQFILNAALASGVALPFGCRMGSCGMCAGRILSGTVDRADQVILTDEQIAQGFTVLCKSRPRSDLTIVTHQEIELGL